MGKSEIDDNSTSESKKIEVAEKKEKTFLIRFSFVSLYSTVKNYISFITTTTCQHRNFSNYDKHAQKAYEKNRKKESTPAKEEKYKKKRTHAYGAHEKFFCCHVVIYCFYNKNCKPGFVIELGNKKKQYATPRFVFILRVPRLRRLRPLFL